MDQRELRALLDAVAAGDCTAEDAVLRLRMAPETALDYANIDMHRGVRQGVPEVIYGASKTAAQIAGIVLAMRQAGEARILVTRTDPEKAAAVRGMLGGNGLSACYHDAARILTLGDPPEPDGIGFILVATGGTSDIPVAEEAAVTA